MATGEGSKVLDVVYVILGLMPFLLLCVRRACTKWDRKNDHVYEALRSPTVREARNAFDRRVALAIREAKQGATECRGCGFANAVRAATCVLCGTALPVKQKKGFFKPKQAAPVTADVVVVTSRQQRVRRRKEWCRQVDQNGRVVWVHDETLRDPTVADFPAYVLRTTFHPRPEDASDAEEPQELDRSSALEQDRLSGEAVTHASEEGVQQEGVVRASSAPEETSMEAPGNDDAADEADDDVRIDIDAVDPPAPKPTIDDAARLLQDELALVTMEVISTNEADAARVAFSKANANPQAVQAIADTVQNAQLVFPSKLAQFVTSMASAFNETNRSEETNERVISRFEITRASVLTESIAAIATLNAQQARAAIRVDFVDEHGVDAGGVYREWFLLLNEEIVKPEAGIFTCVDPHEQTFYLNPQSHAILGDSHLAHFLAAGRLFGRALLDGNVTGFHLAQPLLKIILGLPVTFGDLEYFDPEAYKNLKWLLENDGVDMLGLDFTAVEKLPNGAFKVVDLVLNGSEIDVTDANKREYVDCKLKYMLFGSVEQQLFAFLQGVYEVVPVELLLLFDAAELDYILAGSDEIDVDDWEANTTMSRNIALHPAYFNFWKIVRQLSTDELRRLLQYATGSTRVPPGGFSALTSQDGRLCLFSLNGVLPDTTWGYIHAHACFNRLDIPMVRDIEPLREAVLAVVANESVGFTTI